MVQMKLDPDLCDLRVEALSGVDINDAAARLQSRGDVSDNNIFEILPRFSITAGETNQNWDTQYTRRRDEVLTVTGGGDVTGILVGCELLAFERDKEEPSKQLHFSASVDFVVWRRSILLVGLSSAEILLVDPNTYGINFTWQAVAKLEGKKRFFVDAFIHSNPDPTKIDVIVVSRDGLVCTFRDIALSDGTLDATHDQNVSLDVDLGSIKDISKHSLTISSKIACVCSPTRNNLIVVEEGGNILIVDLLSSLQYSYATSNLFFNINPVLLKSSVLPKKVAAFEGNLFLLLSNGVLEISLEGDCYTSKPLKIPKSNSFIHDYALVRNNNEGIVKLWVLYSVGPSNSTTENYIRQSSLYKFPINVSPYEEPSTIIEMAPNNVLMYHILETSTDVTLQKLLSRGKYMEAKDLAISFSKDLDIVRKAEARDKLSKIIASHLSNGGQCLDSHWTELLAILREIMDAEYVCNFCVEAQLHRVEWVKEIIGLGKTRVSECPATLGDNLLLLTLKKFYTFELVFPSGTINEWKSFISKDNTMFLQSMKFLQNNNFEKCERIWKRHSEEFIPAISLTDFLPFFNVLFDHQLKTSESVSLFKTILVFAVEKLVELAVAADKNRQESVGTREMDVLILIIQRQVCTLESKIDWPVNALKFIKVLSAVIKDEIRRLDGSHTDQKSISLKKKMIVQHISNQLDRLEQILTELKRNHSIRILFHVYTTNEIPEVVNKLLYNLLSQEEVESFVTKYLRPYAERKQLNIDYLFAEHIKSVLQHTHYYIQAINIPHEERIVCLVNLISTVKTKLECTLLISQEWPVPWTSGIAGMVERILATPKKILDVECASLYDNIVTMQKQVPFRCVMNKYKLNSSKLISKRAYVSMALLKILKLKKPGFREDCMELLKNVPCKTLVDENRLEYIEFILRMYNEDVNAEEAISSEMESNDNLRKALFQRVFTELQNMENSNALDIYTEEEKRRCITICSLLANENKDARIGILCKLKQFLPSIQLDIIYNPEFPFTCLTSFFEASD